MQNINRPHSRKKIAIIASTAALILVIAASAAAYYLSRPLERNDNMAKPNNTVDYGPATDEQKKAGEDAKKDFIDRTENESSPANQPTGASSVSISSVNQNGTILSIRTVVSSQKQGTCRLTLSMLGQADIIRTADTQDMGSYSTCKGFDIDTGSMAKGNWKIDLYFNGDAPNAIATGAAEVQ